MSVGLILNILFLLFSIYILIDDKYVLHLAVFNYLLRSLEHSFPSHFSTLLGNVAGLSIYAGDVFVVILIISMILKTFQKKGVIKILVSQLPIYFYILLVVISTIRGLHDNGLVSEFVGDIRKFYYFIIPVLYFSAYPVTINEKNLRFLQNVMRTILAYCFVCWTFALVFGVYLTDNHTLRCLGSDFACTFAMWALYLLYKDIVEGTKHKLSFETLLFIIAIVVLQHNSVYMAFAVGVVVLVLFKFKDTVLKNPGWIVQFLIVLVVVVGIIVANPDSTLVRTLTKTFDKFSQATSETQIGTIGTRYMVWSGLLKTLHGPIDWIFGKTMGTGYHILVEGQIWQNSPHSAYIENLMRVGMLGVLVLMIYVLSLIIKNIKHGNILGAAILVALLVYWYPYSINAESGFIIGMSMAFLSGKLVNNIKLQVDVDKEQISNKLRNERIMEK